MSPSSTPPPPPSSGRGRGPAARRGGAGGRAQRPRYLVVALVAALVFGAGCWIEGCGRLSFYRSDADQGALLDAAIQNDADRARADDLYKRFVDVADEERAKVIPLSAAMFVLGAALLALGVRGFSGRTNPRSALVQIVAAQAIVVAASWFLTRRVREAELDWEVERTLLVQRQAMQPEEYDKLVPVMHSMRRAVGPTWLTLRTVASALIVLALTRPRTRAFFEQAGEPASE